jgi:two-component system NarL family sensor kinase
MVYVIIIAMDNPPVQPSSDPPDFAPEPANRALQRRNRELSILNSIAQALNRSVELDQALNAALTQTAELFDMQTGWVWLLGEDSQETYLAAAIHLPPGLRNHPEMMEGSCYCLDTYMAGDLDGAANVNVITCSRLKKLVDGADGLRYHASVPLYAHGKQLGVLNVASRDWRELSSEDLRLLYTVGDLLSIAIERARLFARRAESGAAEERIRLAREIHDTLAQGLTGIALQLETADALLDGEAEKERIQRAVKQALALAQANLEEARRSVLDLRAAPLEGRSLGQALEELASRMQSESSIPVSCQVSGGAFPLPSRVELGLYRIAQEGLNNVARHARASQAWLELTITPQQVCLVVQDDGQGFDPQSLASRQETLPGHFGLTGLNERARLIGGRLELCSQVGKGTRLEVTVPVVDQ